MLHEKKQKKGGKLARAYQEGQASFENNVDKDNEGHAELQQNFAGVEQGDWAFACFAVPALNVTKKHLGKARGTHCLFVMSSSRRMSLMLLRASTHQHALQESDELSKSGCHT